MDPVALPGVHCLAGPQAKGPGTWPLPAAGGLSPAFAGLDLLAGRVLGRAAVDLLPDVVKVIALAHRRDNRQPLIHHPLRPPQCPASGEPVPSPARTPPARRTARTRLNVADARYEALSAPTLQRSDAPAEESAAAAISRAVRRLGTRGLAAATMGRRDPQHRTAARRAARPRRSGHLRRFRCLRADLQSSTTEPSMQLM